MKKESGRFSFIASGTGRDVLCARWFDVKEKLPTY